MVAAVVVRAYLRHSHDRIDEYIRVCNRTRYCSRIIVFQTSLLMFANELKKMFAIVNGASLGTEYAVENLAQWIY